MKKNPDRAPERTVKSALATLLALTLLALPLTAQDRDAVVQRVRVELATILKKEPAKLRVDQPVTELGADELDVVEWVMAVEEAFRVAIPDEKISDPKTNKVRKEFSISDMAGIVVDALGRAKSTPGAQAAQPLQKAVAITNLQGKRMGFMLTSLGETAKAGEYRGECIFMLLPEDDALIKTELGTTLSALKVAGEHGCRMQVGREKTEIWVTPKELTPLTFVFDAAGRGTLSAAAKGSAREIGRAEFAQK